MNPTQKLQPKLIEIPTNTAPAPRPKWPQDFNPDNAPKIWPTSPIEPVADAGTTGCQPTFTGETSAYSLATTGNATFVQFAQTLGSPQAAAIAAMGQAQNPFAVVVCCSDSRVVPEILMNQAVGDLFVIRTAGNVIDPLVIGSIEYAVLVLKVQLVVFLSHDNCGAIAGAVGQLATNPPTACGSMSSFLNSILTTTIQPNADLPFIQALLQDPTNPTQANLSAAAMLNAQCQSYATIMASQIINNGAQVAWAHVAMVQGGAGQFNGMLFGNNNGVALTGPGAWYGCNQSRSNSQ